MYVTFHSIVWMCDNMPTMKDIARKAGVSLGTVSNVLNNRATVLPENRARVMEAVEQLGFKSNMVARAL